MSARGAGPRPRRGREVFPQVEARCNEDPARFLDREVDSTDALRFIESRIAGIDRLAVLGAWQGVEERLLRTPPKGRDAIKSRLHRRARRLVANGERDDHLEGVDERIARRRAAAAVEEDDEPDDERVLWRHEPCGSLDVERESRLAWRCRACEQRTNRVEAVDPDEVSLDDLPAAHEQLRQAGGP